MDTGNTRKLDDRSSVQLRQLLDTIARRHRLLLSTDKALVPALRELSQRYNDDDVARVHTESERLHAARLHFSLVRDRPKSFEALRELRQLGLLPSSPTLRVLDLGAGLGATTLGALDALAASGFAGKVQCTLVEPDARALALAADLVPALAPPQLSVGVQTASADLDAYVARLSGAFDLILLGQVLSEHLRDMPAEARALRHASLLRGLCSHALAPGGSLVVVEPALRSRSRHLHQVRDQLREQVFAPCPHRSLCPALEKERDWCHEDRAVDLPDWLVPLARAAGLRYQGLTFSYLVLRRDGRSLANTWPRTPARLVSSVRRSKGKSEGWFCAGSANDERPALATVECLDRDAKAGPWRALQHGDVVAFDDASVPPARRVAHGGALTVLSSAAGGVGEVD